MRSRGRAVRLLRERLVQLRRADWIGLAVVLVGIIALREFRLVYVEPERWGSVCAAAAAPLACVPRSWLVWLGTYYLLGLTALLLGCWAFVVPRVAVCVAAVLAGAAGLINYNVTWGMLGLALGIWSWVMALPARGVST